MSYGEIVRYKREKKEMSQRQAAEAIKKKYGVRISEAYLSMIERGERTNLTTKLKNAIDDFFALEPSFIQATSHSTAKDLIQSIEIETWELFGNILTEDDKKVIIESINLLFRDRKK